MRVIGPERRFTELETEITGAGNVDDVVLRGPGGDVYTQVKWSRTAAGLVDEEFLLAARPGSRSLLRKLYDSDRLLRAREPAPVLRLTTNRALDRSDPLLGLVDGRTGLLLPAAAQSPPGSAASAAVDRWARHVGGTRDDLLQLFAQLEFSTGRNPRDEREHAQALMAAAGLDSDDEALRKGLDAVAGWIVDGRRVLTEADIHTAIDELRLHRAAPAAMLVVQAIDRLPDVDEAAVVLDWVDLHDGDSPYTRVRPREPSGWAQMERELDEAAAALERAGWTSVLVRGHMRQAVSFRVGAALPAVRQHTLSYLQHGQRWSTDAIKTLVPAPRTRRTQLRLGPDLAVLVAVAAAATTDVTAYLRAAAVPVSHLLTVSPATGPDDHAIAGPGQAASYAQQIRDAVRTELGRHPAVPRIHLFLAGPGGLALLLGHRWNRLRPTIVYEHLGSGTGYTPSFTVGA